MAYKVREITIRLVVDDEDGPAMDSIDQCLLGDPWPDWLVGVETVSEEARDATDEEAESMGWTDTEGGDDNDATDD